MASGTGGRTALRDEAEAALPPELDPELRRHAMAVADTLDSILQTLGEAARRIAAGDLAEAHRQTHALTALTWTVGSVASAVLARVAELATLEAAAVALLVARQAGEVKRRLAGGPKAWAP